MKKIFSSLLFLAIVLSPLGLTACMDEYDEPDTTDLKVTGTINVPTNSSIYELKQAHTDLFNSKNDTLKIHDDVVIEGVIAANDLGGNLYQTLLIRHIDTTKPAGDPARDQSIILGVRSTFLAPYFQLGQRVRINLNGLWIGTYSNQPKIGQPYKTSSGNWRLGPILFELCSTNIELVGRPDPNAPELTPIDRTDAAGDAWLRASANKNCFNSPQLATVRGDIIEARPENAETAAVGEVTGLSEPLPKIYAPDELHDLGYGVDRTIALQSNTSKVTLRTSTQNVIAFTPLDNKIHKFTGIMAYYGTDNWQLQLRSLDDISAPEN